MPKGKVASDKPKAARQQSAPAKPRISKKATFEVTSKFSVPMFSLEGKEIGKLALPEPIFSAEINKGLLSQALRVYLNNQKAHFSHTKTRAEVNRTTRKLYQQKGTGGARHGSKKAPIFVGGGIALGPKYRKTVLGLPQKMKRAAFLTSLVDKFSQGRVFGIAGLDAASGKTSQMYQFLKSRNCAKALFLTDTKLEQASRAIRNLAEVKLLNLSQANAYEVVKHNDIYLTAGAVKLLS